MLLDTIWIDVTDEKICASVDHEENVKDQELLDIIIRHHRRLHDLHRTHKDVDYKNDLSAVVPLHIPVVVWRDYES